MVNIVLPYTGAVKNAELWAQSEDTICFETDFFEGARCTVSFAAYEVKHFLEKIMPKDTVSYAETVGEGFNIVLHLQSDESKSEEYRLIPLKNGIMIEGVGRAGVLYGAYEFLKLQGFRWFYPGESGEVIPAPSDGLINVRKREDFSPDMYEGRGFDFENQSIESKHLWLWMARNRLDYGVYSHRHHALQKKLCIHFKTGGHIFEEILSPDRVLPSGKTLWEEHKDWYGKRSDGKEVTKANCMETQFCVTDRELIDFLSAELVQYVKTKWSYAEKLDIWGFDTWGNVCNCEACRKLGNSTDRTLHFISRLRDALNMAGIGKKVRLVSCSYEGTSTIEPPENPIPENLVSAGDSVVYYPITRCYEHAMGEKACAVNQRFDSFLRGWTAKKPSVPVVIGEYYNVSKFEDLPIIFTNIMKQDIPHYYDIGVRGITYMHFPVVNLAMRSLTHMLYAELSWNTKADADSLVQDYFEKYYEEYAAPMAEVYDLLQQAFARCTQWRAWKSGSILSQLIVWNGETPSKPLRTDGHFTDHADIIQSGENSVCLLKQALAVVKELQMDFIRNKTVLKKELANAVNPFELGRMNRSSNILQRISEDKRFILYGLDTMKFMTETVRLYDMLFTGKTEIDAQIKILTKLYDKLDSYYHPLGSNTFQRGLNCKSALTRTQLAGTVERCIRLYGSS